MTITISAEDPRSIKAIQIAAGAGQWLRCRSNDGRKAYGVPSQRTPGRYYLVTCETCDCEDFRRIGFGACKHCLAVRLHCELAKAQQPKPKTPKAGPVLDMVREEDGTVRWERSHRHPAPDAETVRLADQYDRTVGRFYNETPEQIFGRL